uniref:Uncharacterized protein n=1 Tax=Haemonchus contortus TaxID=6289 RepID=A0A7I4XZP7_HAECO|nr:unnamed protein product [Haemonchus contortus]
MVVRLRNKIVSTLFRCEVLRHLNSTPTIRQMYRFLPWSVNRTITSNETLRDIDSSETKFLELMGSLHRLELMMWFIVVVVAITCAWCITKTLWTIANRHGRVGICDEKIVKLKQFRMEMSNDGCDPVPLVRPPMAIDNATY